MDKKNAELIVKIIAILGYIGAGFSILGGLIMLLGGSFLASLLPNFGAFIGVLAVVAAVLMIAFGIFAIFVAKGIWNHKNWARIVVIIFSALGVIGGLTSLPSGIIGILINGAVFYFLVFEKTIIGLFK